MSKAELVQNLGTIARSGSKAFVSALGEGEADADAGSSIIGRFGVPPPPPPLLFTLLSPHGGYRQIWPPSSPQPSKGTNDDPSHRLHAATARCDVRVRARAGSTPRSWSRTS
jgi:hypothetical protein